MSGKAPAWAGWRCETCSRTHVAVMHPTGEACPEEVCEHCGTYLDTGHKDDCPAAL
jgi:hypothetical protein